MDKANLIISIIIVLCIATAVAAYGIINNDNPVFSDLSSMSSGSGDDTGNGIGNNTTLENGTSSSSGGSSGSGSSSSGSGTGSTQKKSSSSSSSSHSNGGNGGSSQNTRTTVHTASQIKAIATANIAESGCYAGTPSYSGGYWYVKVYNSTTGEVVSGFSINDKTGHVDLA